MKWGLFFLLGYLLINADQSFAQTKKLEGGFYYVLNSGGQTASIKYINNGEPGSTVSYKISKSPFCLIKDIDSVKIESIDGPPVISLMLNKRGTKILKKVSKTSDIKKIALVANGKIISVPTLMNEISNGRLQLRGLFYIDDANKIVEEIKNEISKK